MSMFCRQCEQTAQGKGCTVQGVCGKTEDTAVLQDLLIHALKGIAVFGAIGRELGVKDQAIDRFMMEGLFTTITNVDFDPTRLEKLIRTAYDLKEKLRVTVTAAFQKKHAKPLAALSAVGDWKPASTLAGLVEQGRTVGVLANPALPEDIRSLREILLYGLKGMAAYADHAALLGAQNETVNTFFYKGLAALVDDTCTAEALIALIMEFGQVNLACLELLDTAHTTHFGNPVPTRVSLGLAKGPAIIVSGHDLKDLEQLLRQTDGMGINIYTHGEMLPAHGYPNLNKYRHLKGHFGTAWQNQQKEFAAVPAAVLMTTNCIQKPADSYRDRIFTTGLVAWPGLPHIDSRNGIKDFGPVIKKAQELGGVTEDIAAQEITVGFAHHAVLSLADKIIAAVKAKQVRHFFLIGGCDGAKMGRNYYTEFAQKVPADCIILTLACGKFRFNTLDFGAIGPFPRLLDCGQCNDAYSAIAIAAALAKAFTCGVNDLPLSFILSWYEQKAVCILLTLFSLGIKNIRLGPTLPAFVSPGVLKVLVEKFNIRPITAPEEDLKAILAA